jgi:hypothetical protein
MRVSTLQIPASIAKLDGELTKIKGIVAAIDGWPRKGFETRCKECEALLAESKEDFKTLMDMRDPLEIVHEDVKALMTKDNRKLRDQRNSVVEEMTGLNVPEDLAKVIAAKVHDRDGRRDSFCDGMAYGTLSNTSQNFDRPFIITYDGDSTDTERTYWHTHLTELWRDQDAVVQPLVPKAEKGLTRREMTHLYKPLEPCSGQGALEPNPPGPANASEGEIIVQPFRVVSDVTPILYVQQCGAYPRRRAAPPIQYVKNK